MTTSTKKPSPAKRLALYRQRAEKIGMRRVEVAVPAPDVAIIRNFARAFREGGVGAERLRRQGELIDHPPLARNSAELYEMLRAGIGEGVDLELPIRRFEEPRHTGF